MNEIMFPDEKPIDVMQRVHKAWEFRLGYIPIPKFGMSCPVCDSYQVQYSRCTWRPHGEGSIRYRADVTFKCTICSHAFSFGVPVTREIFNMSGGKQIRHRWRELKKRMEEADG